MVLSTIINVNFRLKFLYKKRDLLYYHTKKSFAIANAQFDYASNVWFYYTTQPLNNELQFTQNKLFIFVLNLDARVYIGREQF